MTCDDLQRIERNYRQTQNHREKLGAEFINALSKKGASSNFYLGLLIEDIFLNICRSEKDLHFADSMLRSYCGYTLKELVERLPKP